MIEKKRKNTLSHRLNIISGQLKGLSDYIEKEQDCKKVVAQFYAVNSGLKKVIELYFQKNIESCMQNLEKSDKAKLSFLLKEIIKNK